MVDFKMEPSAGLSHWNSHRGRRLCNVGEEARASEEVKESLPSAGRTGGSQRLGVTGPFEKTLWEVLVRMIGSFPDMSGDVHILVNFVACAQAELYYARFDEEPKVAKGCSSSDSTENGGTRRTEGGRLLLDRR
jgi:hypothetical protein